MTGRVAWPSVARMLLAVALLSGCDAIDTMKEGFAHSRAVSDQLEKAVGMKSFVGFNWNNGTLTSVTITFEGIPNAPLKEIVEKSKSAIAAEFKQTPKRVVVGFSIEP